MNIHTFSIDGGWLRKVVPLSVLFFVLILLTGCSQTRPTVAPSQHIPDSFQNLLTDTLDVTLFASGFADLSDINISRSGTVYIADAGRHHVIRLNDEGQRIDSVGGRGTGATQFDRPAYIDAGNELKIYVADSGNRRITMFDRRWQQLGHFQVRDESYEPGPMVQTPAGELIFWDKHHQRLRRIRSDSQTDPFFNPVVSDIRGVVTALAISNEVLFVMEGERGLLHRFSMNGRKLPFLNVTPNLLDVQSYQGGLLLLTSHAVIVMSHTGDIREVWAIPGGEGFHRFEVHQENLYLMSSRRIFRAILPLD